MAEHYAAEPSRCLEDRRRNALRQTVTGIGEVFADGARTIRKVEEEACAGDSHLARKQASVERIAAEAFMLLSAYSELLSNYLRS